MSSLEALGKRFTDLQDRLAALQDATQQLQELIDRLANFSFQPGSVPLGAGEDDNVGFELSSEINQILRDQEEELELLREEIVDFPSGGGRKQHDKDRLSDGARRLEDELQRCRRYFRKAQLTSKRNLETAQREERKLLYASFAAAPRSGASSPAPPAAGAPSDTQNAAPAPSPAAALQFRRKPRAEMSKDEQTLSASSDVTQSLQQTYDLMAAELSKSDYAHKTLTESTAALSQLSESYASLDTLLATSKDLLGTLFTAQKSDTWYLETSLYMLAATVGWLVFRRWLYGPAWWLVWMPLRLLFRLVFGVSSAAVGLAGSSGEGSASSGVGLDHAAPPKASMNNEGAPTIQVSQEQQPPHQTPASAGGKQEDHTMYEEVGRIIDESEKQTTFPSSEDEDAAGSENGKGEESKGEETVLRERREDDGPPNPKKRMMEEQAAPRDERVRDEL